MGVGPTGAGGRNQVFCRLGSRMPPVPHQPVSVSQAGRGGVGVQWPLPPLRHLTCSVVTDSPDRSRVLGGGAAHLVPGRLRHPIQGGLRLPFTLGGGPTGRNRQPPRLLRASPRGLLSPAPAGCMAVISLDDSGTSVFHEIAC
ncbi:unnamed protein product [Eretmochelys imbricata]